MKKTTKVILSSALTMGLCASLIAGSTLAMFSSRSNVNVAITSGKVDVVASVDTDSLTGYSTEWDKSVFEYVQKPTSEMTKDGLPLPDNTFYAGGTYTYDAGELKLDSIAPGDAVEFQLNIENNSTLAIQYRVQLTVPAEIDSRTPQGEVVKQLKVSFNDGDPVTIGDESTFAQKWSDPIDKGVEITETPKVRVELPYELGNDYQGQSCLLHVGVYAVQLGTHVADAEGTYSAYTANDLKAIAALTNTAHPHTFEGETIALGADIDLSPDADGGASTLSIALADTPMTIAETTSQSEFGMYHKTRDTEFKGTFDGNGFRISNFKSGFRGGGYGDSTEPGNGLGLFDTLNGATVKNLILSNVSIVVKADFGNETEGGYGGVLAGKAYNSTIENIVIENSTVVSNTDYTAKRNNAANGSGPRAVEPDRIGALIGRVYSNTTINHVTITLNEDVSELTANETKLYPAGLNGSSDTHSVTTYGNRLVGEGASNVTYVGTSTLVCIPAVGMEERMTFSSETADSVPSASVEIGSVEGLASLTQSVQGGRDYSGMTITLTDDIDLSESALETIGAFKGTIDGGAEGHTISGLDLNYFTNVSTIAMAASLEEVPTLKNVTLEFTQFTGIDDWKGTYVYNSDTPASFIDSTSVNFNNATVVLQDNILRYELHYGESADENKLAKVAYIGLSDEWGDPDTGEGYTYTFENRHFDVSTTTTYSNFKFIGDTYFNITGGTEAAPVILHLDHCLADVSPSKVGNNSRAAFITSNGEGAYVKYELDYNTIRSAQSSHDSFSAAIFSWANTAKESFFRHNTFGGTGDKQQYTFVAIKLMNFAADADVTFHDNTVYITTASYVVDTFDLYQNNSRANTYSAYFKDNKVTNVDQTAAHDAYFLFVEANVLNAQNPAHGRVYVTETNTLNGQKVVQDSYDPETFDPSFETSNAVDAQETPNKFENLEERKQAAAELEGIYQYDFVSWEVTLNGSNQIVSGTFVLGEDFTREQLLELKAPDAKDDDIKVLNAATGLYTVNDGAFAIDSAQALINLGKYICSQDETPTMNIVLTADIDLEGVELPEWDEEKKVTAKINGQGYIVYGMNGSKASDFTGKIIFGNLTDQSTVENITFVFGYSVDFFGDGSTCALAKEIFGETLAKAPTSDHLKDCLILLTNANGTGYFVSIYYNKVGGAKQDFGISSSTNYNQDGNGFESLDERAGRVLKKG